MPGYEIGVHTPDRPPRSADTAKPSRREALTRLGTFAGVIGAATAGSRLVWDQGGFDVARSSAARQVRDYRQKERDADHAELAIARAAAKEAKDDSPHPTATPEQLVRRAVEAMGGMGRFVSRGDVVVVKPNIGWDRMPIHAANTNPDVVAAVIKLAYDAGAKKVVIADGSCNDPNRCFQRSGIWRAAYENGADVILPAEHRFRMMRLNGDVLDEWPVYTPLVQADKV